MENGTGPDRSVLAVPTPGPATLQAMPGRPNPTQGPATLDFELAVPSVVRALIYDVGGRRIPTLADGAWLAAGHHSLCWDGRDDRDVPAFAGEPGGVRRRGGTRAGGAPAPRERLASRPRSAAPELGYAGVNGSRVGSATRAEERSDTPWLACSAG